MRTNKEIKEKALSILNDAELEEIRLKKELEKGSIKKKDYELKMAYQGGKIVAINYLLYILRIK
jgi:pyruvate formate-lyase activating enzyme-like uncharacterized protein